MNDYIAPILKRLTINAAHTLKYCKRVESGEIVGPIHTGLGKYTSLAAGGVISTLRANGLVDVRQYGTPYMTALGVEVTNYIRANWEEVRTMFRDPPRR